MPTPAFISIEGATQGIITQGAFTEDSVGNIYIEGHEDEVMEHEEDDDDEWQDHDPIAEENFEMEMTVSYF